MSESIRILGISGSLRKASTNTGLLRAAADLLPEGMTLETFDLAPIGPYNEDVRAEGFPGPAQKLREAIASADGVLFASPEYNYSVTGVLKNAIDWASRPPEQPFDGKPVAIMGATMGLAGTARAQYHLRQMGVALNWHAMNRPEIMVAHSGGKFDAEGNLTDEETRKHLAKFLEAFRTWVLRFKA